jgi:hypothetical protein
MSGAECAHCSTGEYDQSGPVRGRCGQCGHRSRNHRLTPGLAVAAWVVIPLTLAMVLAGGVLIGTDECFNSKPGCTAASSHRGLAGALLIVAAVVVFWVAEIIARASRRRPAPGPRPPDRQ